MGPIVLPLLIFSWFASLAGAEEPLMINQIVIDSNNRDLLYAASRPQGILVSLDRGESWNPQRTGLKNTSVYHVVIDPSNSQVLYLGTFGGGIYKSRDSGKSWIESNNGLGNTNIHGLAIDPGQPERIVAATSTGDLFQSRDGGGHWSPFSQGLPPLEGEVIVSLRFVKGKASRLYLGERGLYFQEKGLPWKSYGAGLQDEVMTTVEFDPIHHLIYAGTKNNGLWFSADNGKTWRERTSFFRKSWIQLILLSRIKPNVLFVSVLGQGLFKSRDSGMNWERLSRGLPDNDDVLSLAADPENTDRLYLGTHNQGLFISTDGGMSWTSPQVRLESVASIINSIMAPEIPVPGQATVEGALPLPPSFEKCNRCHGWADPFLSNKRTFWRVPPNQRDWRTTVKRMSPGAGLSIAEEEEIISFLDQYSRKETK
jgi:photosystem II stability/assembly factor-like uncharacterized protein